MQQNDLNTVTSLGRPLDPKYPTNLAIMIATPVAALAGVAISLVAGNNLGTALGDAFFAAFSVIMAWIIGREIDPEHDLSAFVGAALAFGAVILLPENPNLFAVFLLNPLTRMVSRTVGPPGNPLRFVHYIGRVVTVCALRALATGYYRHHRPAD